MTSLPVTMAAENEAVSSQSNVQYKKFDNDDAPENDKKSDVTSGANNLPITDTITDAPRPIVDVPLEETNRAFSNGNAATRHEVVLQMNGRPTGSEPSVEQPETEEEWNWINLILSVCSIFCCTVCGILATVTSILAYIDHRVRDFDASRRKRDAAYALALTALISGVVLMVLVVVLSVVLS